MITKSMTSGCSGGLLPPIPPSAFDPTFNAAQWTFSNGNRTVTRTNSIAFEFARGVLSHTTTGLYYFEISCDVVANPANTMLGIATNAANPHNFVGGDAFGWGYYAPDGNKFNGASVAYGNPYTQGDVIGVLVDFAAGTVNFSKNGVDQGQAFNNIAGACFPVASNMAMNDQFTIATGLSQFQFYPGGGALPWG